jgi:hypothetical protein
MRNRIVVSALLLSLAGLGAAETDPARFDGIVKVYVDSLGGEDGSSQIRSALRLHLSKTHRFVVVDGLDEADAVLSGTGRMESERQSANASPGPLLPKSTRSKKRTMEYFATASVELRRKDHVLLWSKEDSRRSISKNASSLLGRDIGSSLIKAAAGKK